MYKINHKFLYKFHKEIQYKWDKIIYKYKNHKYLYIN